MSIEYLNLVFAVSVTGTKKSVLIALADRANKGGYCYPSMDDIAFRSGCSKRSAIRAVSELEKLGYFMVVREVGRPNKYIFLPEMLSTTSDTESPEKDIHRSDSTSAPHDTVSPHQCHGVTQTIKNHQLTKKKGGKRQNQKHGVMTNTQANEIHKRAPRHKPNKKIIGTEMKNIRALLIPKGAVQ